MISTIFHSSFEPGYLWLPPIGFVIGVAASMTGSGGGFLFLPVLILLFDVPAQVAVTTSLTATLPICIVGSLRHFQKGHIDIKLGGVFATTGIVGAILGAGITNLLTPRQLQTFFGIYSILIAFPIFFNYRRRKKDENNNMEVPEIFNFRKFSKGSFYGFLAGIITGTFGTSGAAPVLAGLLTMRMPIKLVVGTSLMVVLINTFSAMGAHFVVGKTDLSLVFFLATGSVFGAFSGPRLLSIINTGRFEVPVRKWYALAMFVIGIIIIIS